MSGTATKPIPTNQTLLTALNNITQQLGLVSKQLIANQNALQDQLAALDTNLTTQFYS